MILAAVIAMVFFSAWYFLRAVGRVLDEWERHSAMIEDIEL